MIEALQILNDLQFLLRGGSREHDFRFRKGAIPVDFRVAIQLRSFDDNGGDLIIGHIREGAAVDFAQLIHSGLSQNAHLARDGSGSQRVVACYHDH